MAEDEDAVTALAALGRLGASYTSGVLAAGSPCVVVLVPLTLYRFRHGHGWPFVAFLAGFMVSYAILGLFATQLLASPVQQGIKAGLGSAFMLLGTAGALGTVDPIKLPLHENTVVLGAVFAALVSVNPWYGPPSDEHGTPERLLAQHRTCCRSSSRGSGRTNTAARCRSWACC